MRRRQAWWVPPANAIMGAATLARRRSPDASFANLETKAARICGVAGPVDAEFRTGMYLLLQSFLAVEDLSPLGWFGVQQEIARRLANRMRVGQVLREHPDITCQPVRQPIFVVGLPRTGTTFLHGLLADHPRARAPLVWELLAPAPLTVGQPEIDRRIRDGKRFISLANQAAPALRTVHPMDACGPEECVFLLPHTLAHHTRARLPEYRTWLAHRDTTPDYHYLKQQLQILQWQQPERRWILKSPFHLGTLDALLRVFPDAVIVWTHRDPVVALSSWCSFVEVIMGLHNRRVDRHEIGEDWSDIWVRAMTRGLHVRQPVDQGRFIDLAYDVMVADPIGAVERIYQSCDEVLPPATRQRMAAHLGPAGHRRRGAHRYAPEHYGLSPAAVLDTFAEYLSSFEAMGLPKPSQDPRRA